MEIKYVSAQNDEIDLKTDIYKLQTADFFNYDWKYDSTTGTRRGGTITQFNRGIAKKKATLSVKASSMPEYYAALEYLTATTEADVLNMTPGRLYVNGYYMTCYVTASDKSEWESFSPVLDNEIEITTEYPFWIKENSFNFPIQSITEDGGRFPMRFPFRFASGSTSQNIINSHYAPCDFKLIIYGLVANPKVTIGGNIYEVTATIDAGEYLTIDTAMRTIIKTKASGEKVNLFNYRVKTNEPFTKVKNGTVVVAWDGSFAFDIVLFEERSEPRWSY